MATRPRVRRQRRRMEWSATLSDDAINVAGNSKGGGVFNQQAIIENLGSPTLVRCHGRITIVVGASGTANDDVLVGAGIAVVSAEAAAAGVASLPGPLSAITFPFLWHATKGMRFLKGLDVSNLGEQWATNGVCIWDVIVDSKAMRKLSGNEELVFMVETDNGAGTASIILLPFAIRLLYMQ